MPTIEFTLQRIQKLLGKQVTIKDLEMDLQWIGLDMDEINEEDGKIKVEYNPNRPDFSSPEGIARALKGYYEIDTGLPTFSAKGGDYKVNVDPLVNQVRPFIATAIVRGISLDSDQVATLMNTQEDLHWAIGRNRKKVAIGVHDLDKIEPPFTYTAVKPDAIKFEPLQMPGYQLTPAQILEQHPKGREFAYILKDTGIYPMIFDKNNNVISFPPIINGTLTMVTDDTKNLFIDMTGTDLKAVNFALNVFCTMLADMGCKIEKVTNMYPDGPRVTPNFAPAEWTVDEEYINSYLGLKLPEADIIKALRKVRLDAKPGKRKGSLDVLVPCYRGDLMHPVDLTEEVAIGFGYSNLPTTIPQGGIGKYHPKLQAQALVRKVMIGLGFQEVVNFILTNKEKSFTATRRKWKDGVVLKNPVSKEYDTTRQDLLSGLLQNLQDNKHESIPIKIFEVGDVIILDKNEETGARRDVHVACVIYDKDAGYTDARSAVDAFMEMHDIESFDVIAATNPFGIEGRTADIMIDKKRVGSLGEIHPEILSNFDLEFPVAFFEMNLEPLI
ncbi:MAG: phenylalanine--tRNA ligase subunit beta [Candidatus Sigynarchaeum springense]